MGKSKDNAYRKAVRWGYQGRKTKAKGWKRRLTKSEQGVFE